MRGFHCVDPSHDRIEFTGADDEDLFQAIRRHTAEARRTEVERRLGRHPVRPEGRPHDHLQPIGEDGRHRERDHDHGEQGGAAPQEDV